MVTFEPAFVMLTVKESLDWRPLTAVSVPDAKVRRFDATSITASSELVVAKENSFPTDATIVDGNESIVVPFDVTLCKPDSDTSPWEASEAAVKAMDGMEQLSVPPRPVAAVLTLYTTCDDEVAPAMANTTEVPAAAEQVKDWVCADAVPKTRFVDVIVSRCP